MREVDGLGAFHNAGDIGLVYQLGTSQDGDGAILRLPYQEKFSYTFGNFFHPFVGNLIQQLNQTSVAGMLDPAFLESLHYAYPRLTTRCWTPRPCRSRWRTRTSTSRSAARTRTTTGSCCSTSRS